MRHHSMHISISILASRKVLLGGDERTNHSNMRSLGTYLLLELSLSSHLNYKPEMTFWDFGILKL